MQNRFGIKDFVLMVLVLAVGLSVWLGMVKSNREWDKLGQLNTKVGDLERQLSRIDQDRLARLDSKITALDAKVDGKLVAAGSNTSVPAAPSQSGTASAGDGWAKQGADGKVIGTIERQGPRIFATDPADQPGFTPGGNFTEIFEVRTAKLTPYIQSDVYGRRVIDLVVEVMADYDPKTLKPRGILADAWQMDPEGKWMRIKLRDEARFSDGVPVTAEDVRYSFHDFVMNPEIEAQRSRSVLGDQIDKVIPLSEKTLEITFKQVLFNNLDSGLGLYVLPKHFYSKLSPAEINKGTGLLMGSGPFKLATLDVENQWTPGQTIELVRSEQYWATDLRPALDSVRFRDISDELARLTAYKNGEGDMITPSAPQFVSLKGDAEFAKNNRLMSAVNMRSGRSGIIWNCGPRLGKLTPMSDKRVRKAMTMLLNREKMITDIWRGVGVVAKGFMNPNFAGSDPDVITLPYDPRAGKALLAEAGWIDRNGDGVLENDKGENFGFELTFFTAGEISQRLATFVKDAYETAGIQVSLRGVDWSVGDTIRKQRDFDAMTMGWGANAPESDPRQIFHSESIKDQGDNFGQWNSPAADGAIDSLRREIDFDKRMGYWRAFDRAMHDEQPYTWIRLQPETRVIKPNIGNVRVYPKGIEYLDYFRASGPLALPESPTGK